MAKKFLGQRGIKFEEVDLKEQPDRAPEVIEISGQMAVPVIVVDKEVVVGFDEQKLEDLLEEEK